MVNDFYDFIAKPIADSLGISLKLALFLLIIVLIWSLVWKGFALWKSVKKNHLVWFVVFLITNTAGILEILYIFVFSEMKFDEKNNKYSRNKYRKRKLKKR